MKTQNEFKAERVKILSLEKKEHFLKADVL